MNFFKQLREDITCIHQRDPAARSRIEILTCYPGLHAILVHRLAHGLWTRGWLWAGRFISHLGRILTGIEIHPGAHIGRRVFIDHGFGVVIGETASVGDDCTIYQGVTLGGTRLYKGEKRHPTLEEGVVVGAGAQILGGFTVGAHARIGSNAVVIKPVPAGATAVGNPARVMLKEDAHAGERTGDGHESASPGGSAAVAGGAPTGATTAGFAPAATRTVAHASGMPGASGAAAGAATGAAAASEGSKATAGTGIPVPSEAAEAFGATVASGTSGTSVASGTSGTSLASGTSGTVGNSDTLGADTPAGAPEAPGSGAPLPCQSDWAAKPLQDLLRQSRPEPAVPLPEPGTSDFAAYAVDRSDDDPLMQVLHELINHAASQEKRITRLCQAMEDLGQRIENGQTPLDVDRLNRMVE